VNTQNLNVIIPIITLVVGFGLSFLQQLWSMRQQRKNEEHKLKESRKDEQWKQEQLRVNMFLEKRFNAYSEGLEFIYEVEQNQTEVDALEKINEKWKKWYPLNCVYLPPEVNTAFFNAMCGITLIIIDINNKDGNKEVWKEFREETRTAKKFLMDLKDIGWIPDDLK